MRIRQILISSLISVISASAFAAHPGAFVGGSIGQVTGPEYVVIDDKYLSGSDGTISGEYADIYNFATRGSFLANVVLGYNINRCFGIEVFYDYLASQRLSAFAGSVTTSVGFSGELKSYAYGFNVDAYYPVLQTGLEVFGKLGLSVLHSQFSVNDPKGLLYVNAGDYQVSVNKPAYNLGAGIQYYYMPQLALKLEWDRITGFNDVKISNLSYDLISAGIIYSFVI